MKVRVGNQRNLSASRNKFLISILSTTQYCFFPKVVGNSCWFFSLPFIHFFSSYFSYLHHPCAKLWRVLWLLIIREEHCINCPQTTLHRCFPSHEPYHHFSNPLWFRSLLQGCPPINSVFPIRRQCFIHLQFEFLDSA